MTSLPDLAAILSSNSDPSSPLARALALLFEPSSTLFDCLVPQLVPQLRLARIDSYSDLIDAALAVISAWSDSQKAEFIAGHPRIGEVKHLSTLSAREQATVATPPEVLARLAHLNACYEKRYPGLRYIAFVNGRSRAVIKDEMEGVLGLTPSRSPEQPELSSIEPLDVEGDVWKNELERAVGDVGKIAQSRLSAFDAR